MKKKNFRESFGLPFFQRAGMALGLGLGMVYVLARLFAPGSSPLQAEDSPHPQVEVRTAASPRAASPMPVLHAESGATAAASLATSRLEQAASGGGASNSPAQGWASKRIPGKWQWGADFGKEPQPALLAFSQWVQRFLAADPSQRAGMEPEGLALAQERREAFLELIAASPHEALAETVPLSVRQKLPVAVLQQLEQRVSGKGDLQVLATVPRQNSPAEAPSILRQAVIGGERYTAHVDGERKNQRTTSNISLHGVALDGQLALSGSPLRVLEPEETPSPELVKGEPVCSVSGLRASGQDAILAASGEQIHWVCQGGHLEALEQSIRAAEGGATPTTGSVTAASRAYATMGNRSILVMLVDFADAPGEPVSVETARANLADVTSFMRSNSFDQINFTIQDVTPVLRMPRTSSSYATNEDHNGLLEDARHSAAAAGFDPSHYDFDIVAFANIGFTWGGLGRVGAKGSWVQGNFRREVAAHELGHNLGNFHANAWVSSTVIGTDGFHREYGNPFDLMGNTGNFPHNHFNANFKFLNGWLTESQLHTVTTNGVYRIFAQDVGGPLQPNHRYAVRIPVGIRAGDEAMDYWIDFRQSYTGNNATANGAVLQWGNDAGTVSASRLLDTHADTYGDMEDAPLLVGETFVDPVRLLSITTLAKGTTGGDPYLDIQVNFTPMPLEQALDLPEVTWSTGGNAPWVGQAQSHDGTGAAASGSILDQQESYLETHVTGPGTLIFWWRVSSEPSHDFLTFSVDGQQINSISGEQPWQQLAWPIPAGAHTLRWSYRKDAAVAAGNDRGWLDQVVFLPETALSNNVPVTGLAGTIDSLRAFRITVPPGQAELIVSLSNGHGDCEFYLRRGGPATLLDWDWRSQHNADEERFVVYDPAPGDWHVLLHARSDYGDVQLWARYGTALLVITAQPQDLVKTVPATAQFKVEASSATPVSYQWRHDGVDLVDNATVSGATGPTLTIQATSRAQSGSYSVIVANAQGQVPSHPATLRVIAPTVLHPPERFPNGTVRLRFADPDGIPFTDPSSVFNFFVVASSDLVNWVIVENDISILNGELQLIDQEAASFPERFYKVWEH